MSKINILSQELSEKIAAGEVIERPASLVKELVENAVDAGSKNIEIIIQDAGKKLIKVIDDGEGMAKEDLAKACLRHATSKISQDADLYNIRTLGFRGEALASISVASRLKITSAAAASDAAWMIEFDFGRQKKLEQSARTKGTTVEASNLFANIPARLKFLKSNAAETSQIINIVTQLALVSEDISFKLKSDGEEILFLPAQAGFFGRITVLCGREIADNLIPISWNIAPLRIRGFISRPGFSQGSKKNQHFFVNQRPVSDRTMAHALSQGYQTYLGEKKFPVGFIFLELPPDQVDVNVHPAKREIKFQDSRIVHDVLAKTIAEALRDKTILPSQPKIESGYRPSLEVQENIPGQNYVSSSQEPIKDFFPQSTFPENFPPPARAQEPAYLQVKDTYIIFPDEKGVLFIDQHAAHERVIYDALMAQYLKKKIEKQRLLLPITLNLSPDQRVLLGDIRRMLAEFGFEIEEFGGNSVALYAYPAMLEENMVRAEFETIISELTQSNISADAEKNSRQVLASIACHSAVRAHQKLSAGQIAALVADLWKTASPHTCPHGRPTYTLMSWDEIEKRFKRK